jgi:hypothetical protein
MRCAAALTPDVGVAAALTIRIIPANTVDALAAADAADPSRMRSTDAALVAAALTAAEASLTRVADACTSLVADAAADGCWISSALADTPLNAAAPAAAR